MSDDFNDFTADADSKSEGGKLREQLEQSLRDKKELAERLAKLEEVAKASERNKALEKAGVPEVARELFTGDPTEDNVNAFIDRFGSVLGISRQVVTPEEQEQREKITKVQAASLGATQVPSGAALPDGKPISSLGQNDFEAYLDQLYRGNG